MSQNDLLRLVIGVLENLGVRYMVVGSIGSMIYGEPRMTRDIDVVVDLNERQASALCRAFGSDDFYVSEEEALQAVRRKGQFNIIHPSSGNKVDIMIAQPTPRGRVQMERRQRTRFLPDLEGFCARPEDIILSKMEYYREGGSEKHLRDIAGILKVSGDQVDRAYVAVWAEQMGVTDVWNAIVKRLEANSSGSKT